MKRLLICWVAAVLVGGCGRGASESAVQTAIADTQAAGGEAPAGEQASVLQEPTTTPEFTPLPTHTPTRAAVDWFLDEAEVVSMFLFEAGEDPSNAAARDYDYDFPQADARVIYCDLQLEHPGPEKSRTMGMEAVYYGPDGGVYGQADIQPVFETGWQMSNWIIGYGWDDPGNWEAGSYRVEVLVGDQVIASESFEIIQNTPTPEVSPTPTPMPGAVVDTNSLNIRSGPDTVYSIAGGASKGDRLEILGQAYSCGWLKIETSDGVEGWVSSELVTYELPCSQIPAAEIPPTPIPLPTATATKPAPTGKTISVKVINNTGGTLSMNLSGPASYSFTFTTGTHTIQVLPGTYTYTVWGCGTSASGSYKLSKGDEWTWYCE